MHIKDHIIIYWVYVSKCYKPCFEEWTVGSDDEEGLSALVVRSITI